MWKIWLAGFTVWFSFFFFFFFGGLRCFLWWFRSHSAIFNLYPVVPVTNWSCWRHSILLQWVACSPGAHMCVLFRFIIRMLWSRGRTKSRFWFNWRNRPPLWLSFSQKRLHVSSRWCIFCINDLPKIPSFAVSSTTMIGVVWWLWDKTLLMINELGVFCLNTS